ncbi:MAG: hypothetical protein ABMA02_06140 [Saprospiraceae bacterium]
MVLFCLERVILKKCLCQKDLSIARFQALPFEGKAERECPREPAYFFTTIFTKSPPPMLGKRNKYNPVSATG